MIFHQGIWITVQFFAFIGSFGIVGLVTAQDQPSSLAADSGITADEIATYPTSFFEIYQPNNAFDMVRQIPGFQIDDGDTLRGYGGVGGNILINNKRPTAKNDTLSSILSRIPVSHVDRIQLYRGQVPGVDLRGQSVVANIILRNDVPMAGSWSLDVRKHSLVRTIRPEASISASDRWQDIDYNFGFSGFRAGFGDKGVSKILDGSEQLTEERHEKSGVINLSGNVFLNASTWMGETLLQLNTKLGYSGRDELLKSHRIPQLNNASPEDQLFGDDNTSKNFEFGIDAERNLNYDLISKGIFLVNIRKSDKINDHRIIENSGFQPLFRVSDSTTKAGEVIGRMEFDWIGWDHHVIQANIDGAFNFLDNSLVQFRDTDSGPQLVDVPGSNARVEEIRGNILIKDNWSPGGKWTLDYGISAESSRISQSGEIGEKRNYFFVKPESMFTYSLSQERQMRVRLAREVSQLSFGDFVSATEFLDDDLALGNPNLRPESTWVAEFDHEQRFGRMGAVTLKLFHHWISDVEDLLPISDDFEVPGNIGDGRRWGVGVETTVPLAWLGLTGARIDVRTRWQQSKVTDPVTGDDRVLTATGGFFGVPVALSFVNENEYAYSVAYRQDFAATRVAWGWAVSDRGQRPRFKVNELDVYNEGTIADVFIETTRWWNIKARLEVNNLLNLVASRERTIFTGLRGLSLVERREFRTHSVGRRVTLAFSGAF